MSTTQLATAFLVGLLGSGHCVAMCGGIATALEMAVAPGTASRGACRAGYQAGRLAGYAVAGALAGGLGAGLLSALSPENALAVARWLQAGMLVLLGLYLSALWSAPLTAVERVGGRLWQALSPLRSRLLPVRGPLGALRMGLLWGFLPCGLVYSALALALATGSAPSGALTMLAFGAGTLPSIVLASSVAGHVSVLRPGSPWRRAAGVLIMASGIFMAFGAATMSHRM